MSKKPKRDNAHYEQRLKAEFPDIHGDVLTGRISSLRKALVIAGLKPQRTRLEKLKNSWAKATPGERDGFLTWLAISGVLPVASPVPPAAAAPSPLPAGAPIASGRYLLPSTISRIRGDHGKASAEARRRHARDGFFVRWAVRSPVRLPRTQACGSR